MAKALWIQTIPALFLLCLRASRVQAQTVPAFMTCDDKREKCTLDCVLSVYLGESDQEGELAACRLGCIKEHTECVDSDEVSAAMECVTSCAMEYDAALVECLRLHSKTKKATFNQGGWTDEFSGVVTCTSCMSHSRQGQDACSIAASNTMDDCSMQCYGEDFDPLGGWTPEKEAGTYVAGYSEEVFRVPRQSVVKSLDGSIKYVQVSPRRADPNNAH